MSYPTISAIKANNVKNSEQGRIQGALFSVQSLASAMGPLLFRVVYHKTKDTFPGAMFVCASCIMFCAALLALALPGHQTNSNEINDMQDADALLENERRDGDR